MGDSFTIAKLAGSALPGNGEVVPLFNTVTLFGGGNLVNTPLKRVGVVFYNDQAGTMRVSHSIDGGTTWRVFQATAVAIPAANAISGPYEVLLDQYRDVKIDWVNGATPQTVFEATLTGYESRMPPS